MVKAMWVFISSTFFICGYVLLCIIHFCFCADIAICLTQDTSVRSESASVDKQLTMNSEQNMHELGNEVTSEDLEPPARNSKNTQAMGPYPDEGPFTECRCVLISVFNIKGKSWNISLIRCPSSSFPREINLMCQWLTNNFRTLQGLSISSTILI